MIRRAILFKKDKSLFVGPNAVKEAFDKFPTGIGFFNSKGLLIISNNTMNAILYDQIHKELQYESELLNVLATCCDNTLISESGTVWQFQRKKIKKNWIEYVAFDITAIYKKNRELQKNNEELKNMLDNIRTTNRNIVEIAREQEILSMKILIHNDMGRNILSLQRYYANGCNPSEKEDIIRQINKTISVLNWEDDEEDEVDDIKELTEIADSIGVKLEITGKMPKNKDSLMLVADSLRECITNVVKHAGGDRLFVNITDTDTEHILEITNNGNKPKCEIVEAGGLKSLRKKIINENGKMEVISRPEYKLIITIPKKEDELHD